MKNFKVVTYCPTSEVEKIINVMSKAGAGIVGEYTHCAFITNGEGTWFSPEGTNPTLGKVGELSKEPESRIEMICSEDKLQAVVSAIKANHSFEMPEINVYELSTIPDKG